MSGRDASGFTLLEAIVALAVLSLVGIAALASLGQQLRTADRSNRVLEATALAQDRFARIQLLGADELEFVPDSLERGVFAPPFSGYRWTTVAREVPDESDLYDVQVTVEWESGSYELRSRLYRAEWQATGLAR